MKVLNTRQEKGISKSIYRSCFDPGTQGACVPLPSRVRWSSSAYEQRLFVSTHVPWNMPRTTKSLPTQFYRSLYLRDCTCKNKRHIAWRPA